MITNIKVKNFKKFGDIEFELGQSVVLIGPNNSGKTTALQALALWHTGLKQWLSKRGTGDAPTKRAGVTIGRKDLIAIPNPTADHLWKDLHVRNHKKVNGKLTTENILVEIIVEMVKGDKCIKCGLEFDYANAEYLYCRPLRLNNLKPILRMPIPTEFEDINVTFLPPMSGLAAVEPKLEQGTIDVLLGEGQTAQVLRNLCYQISQRPNDWKELCEFIKKLFGISLNAPEYKKSRGEITMSYIESSGVELDLISSGRGLQQMLLLLAQLFSHPGAILLLDEPDAHLEILRQRQIYQIMTEVAKKQNSQIVAASHSEIILEEAAMKDMVIAFIGRPHRIDDRGSQLLKSLNEIGFDQYYQAEEKGWVLYLEGSTDLEILREFAKTLNHEAEKYLERPFVHYVANQPQKANVHFFGLREAKRDLQGIGIFDRLDKPIDDNPPLKKLMWKKREIENYLCFEEVLIKFAQGSENDDLFRLAKENAMRDAIFEITNALKTLSRPDPWGPDIKASDEFLDALFESYHKKLSLPNLMRKTNYHELAKIVPANKIDGEIKEKLDAIVAVAKMVTEIE